MEVHYANKRIGSFIDSVEKRYQGIILRMLDLLVDRGNNLRMPYSKALGKGLFELRIIDVVQVRIFYTFYAGEAWLLHGFIKKQQQTPIREIAYARKILKTLASI